MSIEHIESNEFIKDFIFFGEDNVTMVCKNNILYFYQLKKPCPYNVTDFKEIENEIDFSNNVMINITSPNDLLDIKKLANMLTDRHRKFTFKNIQFDFTRDPEDKGLETFKSWINMTIKICLPSFAC